jgi:hypothetical protein
MARRIQSVVGALALVLGLAGFARADAESIERATVAARAWLGILDDQEFDESWRTAGKLLKAAVAQEKWTAKLSVTLGPLGKKSSRVVKSSEYSTTMPGAPDGEYVLIQFDTSFANKNSAVETVVMMRESDGLWRVSGYYIR